jgi:hypothetical protein
VASSKIGMGREMVVDVYSGTLQEQFISSIRSQKREYVCLARSSSYPVCVPTTSYLAKVPAMATVEPTVGATSTVTGEMVLPMHSYGVAEHWEESWLNRSS